MKLKSQGIQGIMGDDTIPGRGLMEMIPDKACMDQHEGRRLRSTEIHDTPQLGIFHGPCCHYSIIGMLADSHS